MPRRATVRQATIATAAVLTLAACSTGPTSGGSDSAGPDDGATTQGAASPAAASEDTGTFPVMLEHAFGSTEIAEDPQRIVTVGWTDHEVVAALGEVPVGAVQINWGGNEAGSTDWFDEAVRELGVDPADVKRYDDSDGIPVDEIAAMEPDLIIGTNSGLVQEDYDRLSQLAPTVAFPEMAWSTPWRESVEMVGQAIGRPEQAQKAIADSEAAFGQARDDHPQLEGTSFAWGWFTPTDLSTIGLYAVTDLRPQFLTELGMVNSPTVEELTDGGAFTATLSAEQADTLDADVFVFYVDDEVTADTVTQDPLLSQVPAVRSGAFVASADQQAVVGMSSPTPLSIPVAIEEFIPEVAEAAATAAGTSGR